jgi:microcystin-dependent protein
MSDITPGYTFTSGEKNVNHTKLNAAAAGEVNDTFFTGRSADTAPDIAAATLVFYDSTTQTQKKATLSNLVFNHASLLHGRATTLTPASADEFLLADASDNYALGKATMAKLAEWMPFGLTASVQLLGAGTPDPADLACIWDASSSYAPIKILLSALRDMILPTGLVVPCVAAVPTSWLECDGSAVSRSTYGALHTLLKDIGGTGAYAYGAGDGSTTFNLPDFRGRSLIGSGTGTMSLPIGTTVNDVSDLLSVAANDFLHTGVAVRYSAGGNAPIHISSGDLSEVVDYYIIRWAEDGSTVKLAATYDGAMAGVGVDFDVASITGTHTLTVTLAARALGQQQLGAEIAPIGATQLPTLSTALLTNAVSATAGSNAVRLNTTTNGNYVVASALPKDAPSSAQLVNNLPPSAVARWIIKT